MAHEESGYTFTAAAEILEVPESRLRYWSQVGFVGPSKRASGKPVFTFRDLVNVKAAKELLDRGFSTAQIRRALDQVRSSLPAVEGPLARLRVAFDGHSLVVTDEGAAFEPSGQRVFDFALSDLAMRAAGLGVAPATPLLRADEPRRVAPGARTAFEWLQEGLRIEDGGRPALEAEASYKRALELDSGLSAAHTNLGIVAYRRGDRAEARASFETALALDPDQPEARYNLASLLIEDGETEVAAAELRRVLQLRPELADAHYNLSTALERMGGRRQAREHLLRFLELEAAAGRDEAAAPWHAEARERASRL